MRCHFALEQERPCQMLGVAGFLDGFATALIDYQSRPRTPTDRLF